MNKIGIFFGPEGGSTHRVARRIADTIGPEHCALVPVKSATVEDLELYSNLIFGISTIGKETWDAEPVADDWSVFIPEVEKANFTGRKVAIFGLGDHVKYPDHFVDAMGALAKLLAAKGVNTIGKVDPADYEFNESEGIVDGQFVGLPIDEDFQEDLTNQRIEAWVDVLMQIMK